MIDASRIAVSYAREREWEVFPTDPETDELPEDWEHRATAEPQGVRELWEEIHPEGNPALKCGPRSGVLVLDVDPRHGGGELLDRLEEELGRLPDTLIARTGGGGLHLLFEWVDLGRATLEPWGSEGGLVVRAGTEEEPAFVWLPPTSRTEHGGRRYEWRNPETPIAWLPDTWVQAIRGEREALGAGTSGAGQPGVGEPAAGEPGPGAPLGAAPVEAGPREADVREPMEAGESQPAEEPPPWYDGGAEAPGGTIDREGVPGEEEREAGEEAEADGEPDAGAPRPEEPLSRPEEPGPVWTPEDLVGALREAGRAERTSPMLLWKHATTCLLGPWNSGKSTVLASDLAAVVSKVLQGGPERRVLWISEMSRAETAHCVANAGLEVPELTEAGERGLLEVVGLRGTPLRSWADLEARIDAFGPDLIYVDTLSALLDRFEPAGAPDPSDTAAWERVWGTRLADWTARWARDGLVAVDRTAETDPGGLVGSGGTAAGADVALYLQPGDQGHGSVRQLLTLGGRGVRAGRTTYARFLESGRYGRYVPLSREEVRELEGRKPESVLEDEAQPYFRVLEAVAANPGATSNELYDLVRGREKAFRAIRDRLVRWNLIEDRPGSGGRGHSWHLVEGVDPGEARERVLEELRISIT